jgi:hypothetical protein
MLWGTHIVLVEGHWRFTNPSYAYTSLRNNKVVSPTAGVKIDV